ncbi:hypothetical protein Tco_1317913 [Tanacetum coccineum]
MILESLENGPLIWPTVEENGVIRTKKYVELSAVEKIQFNYDASSYSAFDHDHDILVESRSWIHSWYQSLVALDLGFKPCRLYGDEAMILKESLMMLLVSNVMEFGVDVTDNNRICYTFLEREEAQIFAIWYDRIRVLLTLLLGSKYLFKYCCAGWIKISELREHGLLSISSYFAFDHDHDILVESRSWIHSKGFSNGCSFFKEAGQILDEEQLAFLADLRIPASQTQIVIPHNAAFQTEDLDTYDLDCDDLSTAQVVLMANISNYGSDVISEDFEQSPVMDFTDNEISSDSNIIPYSQYLQETQQATVQYTNLQAQKDSMILSVIEQMSEQMINHVNNWEKANKEHNNESITAELERYKERVKTF